MGRDTGGRKRRKGEDERKDRGGREMREEVCCHCGYTGDSTFIHYRPECHAFKKEYWLCKSCYDDMKDISATIEAYYCEKDVLDFLVVEKNTADDMIDVCKGHPKLDHVAKHLMALKKEEGM